MVAVLLCAAVLSQATNTLTVNLQNIGTGGATPSAVKLELAWNSPSCDPPNVPRVLTAGVLNPSFTIQAPAGSSTITATIYSTEDIDCGGQTSLTWYHVSFIVNGVTTSYGDFMAHTGIPLNLNNATPITTGPVVNPPTGDSTYCRIDGGNCGFTGPISTKGITAAGDVKPDADLTRNLGDSTHRWNASLGAVASVGITDTGTSKFSGPFTFTNHNQMYWAGPGATPTIDQAIAACGSNPCVVEISPGYTGPESVLLIDPNSSGNPFFSGANNVTVQDRRAITAGGGKNYSVMYGGRTAGELTRMGIVNYCNSPTDSCSSGFNLTFISGTMPSNSGQQMGNTAVATLVGSLTWGSSASLISAQDSEVEERSVGQDLVRIPLIVDHTATVNSDRTYANTTTSSIGSYYAGQHTKAGGSGATTFNAFGFIGANQGGFATVENDSFYSHGNWLTDNETQFRAISLGAPFTISSATESGSTVTITTSATCNITAGQLVAIAGVGVAGYNGSFYANTACSGGTTFTYTDMGNVGLGASSGGTATPGTPVSTAYYRNTNGILYQPLSDTVGWDWQTQGNTQLFHIDSTKITSSKVHNFGGDARPLNDNGAFLGGSANHWAGLFLSQCTSSGGTCAGKSTGFVSIAAAATTVTVNTTEVSANSTIHVTRDNSLGSALGVTCNTQSSLVLGTPYVSARSAGTSFTVALDVAPTTNPLCFSFTIIN